MKFKNVLKLTMFFLLPMLLWGCFEDHASQFHLDDANQVEWAPPDRGATSNIWTYDAVLDANETEPVTLSFTVQLIGAQTGSDRTAGVTVSDTDAEQGVHFELLDEEVVIPANSNEGEVQVRINAENIDIGEFYSVTLELQEGPELGVAVNMKDLLINIEKEEPEPEED